MSQSIDFYALKRQIEATKAVEGLGIGEREFAWVYGVDRPIELLPESKGLATLFARGSNRNVIEFIPPRDTDATTFIHNHPSSNVTPSYEDTVTFLSLMATNPKLKYSVIAATKGGEVNGFLEMVYTGERSSIPLETITAFYWALCEKRQKEIREKEDFINWWGKCIFSLEELMEISINVVDMAGLQLHFVAMPRYKKQGWEFIKDK